MAAQELNSDDFNERFLRVIAPDCGECNEPIQLDLSCSEDCERGRTRPRLAALVAEIEAADILITQLDSFLDGPG